MGSLKITKKHHEHFNNPFPSKPRTFPLIQGTLFSNPQTIPSQKVYDIGHDFLLNWSSINGGFLSIFHKSNPSRSIWSTVPGRAFVSAAVADTEVEESRGSFAIKEGNIHLLCSHQTIDDIRIINGHQDSQLPIVLIKGRIFNVKEGRKGSQSCVLHESMEVAEKKMSKYAKYWVLFDQKTKNQVGFQVRLGKPNVGQLHKLSPRSYSYRGFARKMGRFRRIRVGWFGYLLRKRVDIAVSPLIFLLPLETLADAWRNDGR